MIKYSSFNLTGDSEVFAELLKSAADSDKGKYTSDVYNVDTGEDKTGKELIERAHPEKMEVLESYIIDGGVLENQTEQQEVSMQIANKMPDNKVSRKTMATSNLLNELIIIAEEMDVRGEEGLVIFADNISRNIQKKAIAPLAIGAIVAGVAAVTGAYFYMVHCSDSADFGPGKNLQSVNKAIEEYKSEKLSSDYDESSTMASDFLNRLQSLVIDVFNSRNRYLSSTRELTLKLQQMYNIEPEKGEAGLESDTVKDIIESPEAKGIIAKINSYNAKYNKYITTDILPTLNKYSSYLKDYFGLTEHMSDSEDGNRSTLQEVWDKVKGMAGYTVISAEAKVLNALNKTIESLQVDMRLRTKEKDLMVKTLSTRIVTDIQEQFGDTGFAAKPADSTPSTAPDFSPDSTTVQQ